MRSDLAEIELAQQVIAAIPTSCAHNGAHLGTRKHLLQFARASLDSSREVYITVENRFEIDGTIAKLAQHIGTRFQQGELDIAGGRYDADGVARLERCWLDSRLGRDLHGNSILNEKFAAADELGVTSEIDLLVPADGLHAAWSEHPNGGLGFPRGYRRHSGGA